MAISSLRLRRALAISSSVLNSRPFSTPKILPPPLSNLPSISSLVSSSRQGISFLPSSTTQFLSFRTTAASCDRRSGDGEDRKIDPDEILFEGCDYNHWLITMEFPKDPKPTAEEMVETYVQTLAKVVGSVEEAKKRMYACSTTTYQGFQAVMTEEMSEKFRGLPGVVFILPDSYIDPVNKEYGGDKYDNGVITPRPPPVQYGRQGRYGDRNRNYDRPRFDRQQGPPPQQANYGSPDRRGYGHGDGRDGFQREPSQTHQGPPPQQPNYGSPDRRGYGPGDGRDGFQRESYQGHQGPPPQQPNYGSPDRRGYGPGDGRDGFQRDSYQGHQGPPPPQPNYGSSERRGYGPGEERDGRFPQGPPPGGNNMSQGQGYGESYNQGPPPPGQNISRPPEGQGNWTGPNQGQY